MALLDIDEVMKILPHRYPMLMVDRILECDSREFIVGVKNVTVNEPCFTGHFPGRPIMPGVLQIEAMAQVGGVLISLVTGIKGLVPLFMAIDKAKFRQPVRPGDVMRIEIKLINRRPRVVRVQGRTTVDGKVASEAELLFMFTNEKADS